MTQQEMIPRVQSPEDLGLPKRFKAWRYGQYEAVERVCTSEKRIFLLDAPTGVGKSLIGVGSYSRIGYLNATIDKLAGRTERKYRCIYVTRTKQLQRQILCVGPMTRVLTSDLRWVNADTLQIGDSLMGFDEHTSGGGHRRLWHKAKVLNAQKIKRPAYKLTFDDGTVIIASDEHPWLSVSYQTTRGQSSARWIKTGHLRDAKSGRFASKISRLTDVWEHIADRTSGYLAAAFDGEGCLTQKPVARGADVGLSFSQRPNAMLFEVERLLQQKGFQYLRDVRQPRKENHSENVLLHLRRRPDILRFLGEIRPERLLSQFDPDKMGAIFNYGVATLMSKESLGECEVIALETSTKTFVAEGLASHNSEFPMAREVKGRNNYPCNLRESDFPTFTAEHCTSTKTSPCESLAHCHYLAAKSEAYHAPLAVLNDAYYLGEVNGPGQFRGCDLLVIDEVDGIENALMNFIQLTVSEKQLNKYKISPPANIGSAQEWINWAGSAQFQLDGRRRSLEDQLDLPLSDWSDVEIDMKKQAVQLGNFQEKLRIFSEEVNDTWIFYVDQNERGNWKAVFKPVIVGPYAERYLWRHADSKTRPSLARVLGMSGTIFDAEILANDVGIEEWDYARMDSPFPIEHRPIYFKPLVNLVYSRMQEELPRLARAVQEIIDCYPAQKVLIHTVSYEVQQYLMGALSPGRLMTHNSDNREEKLEEFKDSPEPRVMLSPSFDRGVSLKDDDCRCVIICKTPWLSLADRQVKARLALPNGQRWYNLRAAQTVVQMSGRGVRSKDDFCDTWILDRQFERLLFACRNFLPKWWTDAIRRM